jgi:hypothetical protein
MPSKASRRKARRRAEAEAEALAAEQADAALFSHLTSPSRDVTAGVPAEILHEVVSYFQFVPFDSPSHGNALNAGYYLKETALVKYKVLRAMSQTCRKWRGLLLPMMYESVELGAIAKPHSGEQWFIQCAQRLIKICGGLGDSPELARYTRCVLLASGELIHTLMCTDIGICASSSAKLA